MELQERALYQKAYLLSIFTVVYNIAEGLFSIYFGYEDETLSLLGFGIDSFIEVVSGLGIFIMIRRLLGSSDNENFETTALKITGTGFYILAAGLIAGGIFNIVQGHRPETTIWGIIISLVSIIVMI